MWFATMITSVLLYRFLADFNQLKDNQTLEGASVSIFPLFSLPPFYSAHLALFLAGARHADIHFLGVRRGCGFSCIAPFLSCSSRICHFMERRADGQSNDILRT